ncbi:hypothetical protein [Micromonospora peucetia]|uniref:Transcriptional regulator, AbiEi antitoxin, Type IV TA system n=1 Tax=Micromonospora peucetia TaxID=47871 RepID=A0ABZ1EM57_9ACTN|nr:hypothetical protein [Micromonospora peucetia]WSA35340.1 hypothetical protein OIE14_15490 [Micromonospora peucetia]
MPPPPHRPGVLAWQVFRGSDAIRQGLVTEHQLRSSAWLRLRHDVYADARLDRDHTLACRAAALRLPPEAIVAGPSAAYLHGVGHAASFTDDVHVLAPRAMRLNPQRGLRVHSTGPATSPSWPPARARGASGGPGVPASTDPAAAAWETAVWLEPLRAVGIVDSLLRQGLTSRAALVEVAARNADRPGGRRARWVFGLTDPGARSPAESELRVRLVLGGLPRPAAQHPIRVAAGLLLHADLAWPAYRVAVTHDGWQQAEADSGQHAEADSPHLDRIARLVGAGWLVLPVTGRRLRQDFPGVLCEVRAALAGRGWRP